MQIIIALVSDLGSAPVLFCCEIMLLCVYHAPRY